MNPTLRHFARCIALGCCLLSLADATARAQFNPEDIPPRGSKVPKMADLDDLITQFMSKNEIATSSVGVSRTGKVIYYRSFGWTDQSQTTAVQPNVMMRVGSLTKLLVAAGVSEAITEAGLTLENRVFRHPTCSPEGILDLSDDTCADPRYFQITVCHLIEHTSGMASNHGNDPTSNEVAAATLLGITGGPPNARDMLRCFYQAIPLISNPGASNSYSNAGYLALGQVIEELTGRTVRNYVYDRVLRTVGVNSEDFAMGRSLFENRLDCEPWYQSTQTVPSVFDPNATVPKAYGGFCLESRVGQGAVVTTPLTFLRFMQHRSIGSGGIPVRSSAPMSQHTGSLHGTSSLARQMGGGINYSVILSKKGDDVDANTRYSLALKSLIDDLLQSYDTDDWPTADVVAEPSLQR